MQTPDVWCTELCCEWLTLLVIVMRKHGLRHCPGREQSFNLVPRWSATYGEFLPVPSSIGGSSAWDARAITNPMCFWEDQCAGEKERERFVHQKIKISGTQVYKGLIPRLEEPLKYYF